jgi:hypothetical protein
MSPPKPPPPHYDYTRRRTDPLGVDTTAAPTAVDPEITNSGPPPGPPPPDEWAALPIGDRLAELRDGLEAQARATARVWGARHDETRLDRMEARLDRAIPNLERAVTSLDHWVPQLQSVMGQTSRMWEEHMSTSHKLKTFLEIEWPRAQKAIDGLTRTLDDAIGRLGRVEHGQQETTRNHGLMAADLRSVQGVVNSIDVRVTALEQRNRDADNQAKGGDLVVAKATKWASALKGVIGAAIVAVVWIVKELL